MGGLKAWKSSANDEKYNVAEKRERHDHQRQPAEGEVADPYVVRFEDLKWRRHAEAGDDDDVEQKAGAEQIPEMQDNFRQAGCEWGEQKRGDAGDDVEVHAIPAKLRWCDAFQSCLMNPDFDEDSICLEADDEGQRFVMPFAAKGKNRQADDRWRNEYEQDRRRSEDVKDAGECQCCRNGQLSGDDEPFLCPPGEKSGGKESEPEEGALKQDAWFGRQIHEGKLAVIEARWQAGLGKLCLVSDGRCRFAGGMLVNRCPCERMFFSIRSVLTNLGESTTSASGFVKCKRAELALSLLASPAY